MTDPNRHLIDSFNRHLNYLRISITDRCNLRCIYCEPRELVPLMSHSEILSYEEILRLVNIGVSLGISKVRVTGGEPLVRKGVYSFLQRLSGIKAITDLSLTTNGVFLEENAEKIMQAGIKRINISLDTLNSRKYRWITGKNDFYRVWRGIFRVHELGFYPIKINVVALSGINDNELTDIARLSFDYPFHIRFIEHMPMGGTDMPYDGLLLAPEIMKRVESLARLIPIRKERRDGPAERFRFEGARGEIGFIRPLTHHFCSECNRLRLTADGQLRPCLLSDYQQDLKRPLREGADDQQIASLIVDAVRAKPFRHTLNDAGKNHVKGRMGAIGG